MGDGSCTCTPTVSGSEALDDDGSVPQRAALCTKAVSLEQYPADFSYDPTMRVLRIGDGEFSPVSPDVWDYSVSGLQVVKSWLDRRKRDGSGRKSSPLDEIRPEHWEFTEELLELLWVLEATLALQPEGAALLHEVCSSQLFTQDELPTPSSEERQSPRTAVAGRQQLGLLPEDSGVNSKFSRAIVLACMDAPSSERPVG